MTDTGAVPSTEPGAPTARTAAGLGWPLADGVPSGGLGWPGATTDPHSAREEHA